ncbi:MAG: hypothetical protein CL843_07265 [Crocinitomicaceae bacterium]|nr:hypothetical protein [Crocinitomicaceae bacterium]|tara:strand:+ start:2947 stop:3438 length:492 start_codon:yes stop_codon:yes gene_type:complete
MDSTVKLEEMLLMADQDIKDGYYESGVKLLEEILSIEPRFGKAYNHLGWLYYNKFKDFEKAENYFKLALEHLPEYVAIYYNYAILLSTLKRFDELEKILEKALTFQAVDKATIANEYGIMHEQLGNFEEAIKHYKECASKTFYQDTQDLAIEAIERCKKKLSL